MTLNEAYLLRYAFSRLLSLITRFFWLRSELHATDIAAIQTIAASSRLKQTFALFEKKN